jgi:hypothetical protein
LNTRAIARGAVGTALLLGCSWQKRCISC